VRGIRLSDRRPAWLALALIVALGVFLRVWKILEQPAGLHFDEAGAAYDALSLARYGTDRYGNVFPVYLPNYGSGQSALFAWLAALTFKLFGYSLTAMRLTMAASGSTTILSAFGLARESFGRRGALAAALLVAVSPFFVMSSRYGLDCYMMGPGLALAAFLLTRAANRKRALWYALAGLASGITLYSYALSWVVLPVMLLLVFLCLLRTRALSGRCLISFLLPLFVLALPLLLFVLINAGYLGEIRTPFLTIPLLSWFRGSELSAAHFGPNLKYLLNLFTGDGAAYDSLPGSWPLFAVCLPFAAAGLAIAARDALRGLKERRYDLSMTALCAAAGVFACMLLLELPAVYKANGLYVFLVIFTVYGLRWALRRSRAALVAASAVFCVSFSLFFNSYYLQPPVPQPGFQDVMAAITEANERFPESVLYIHMGGSSSAYEWAYIYALLADETDPAAFNAGRYEYGGVTSFGRYRFYNPVTVVGEETVCDVDAGYVYLMPAEGLSATMREFAALLESEGFTSDEAAGGYRIWYHE